MVRPAVYPLSLYRGDSYKWRFVFWLDDAKTQVVDLTGASAAAQIRDKPDGQVMAMTCAVVVPNIVDVVLPAADWASNTLKGGGWDLQVTYPSGEVITFVAGAVTIKQDVTV
jgi:hypothetical protein